ncbi:Hypothetical protein SMAX5B_013014 [Scophthalmus maximus]|uniref:Uncharacterized protein n=1 Tax=Scophthalmus maximus TaxID=52904 RepID=A0A2U9CQ07_SCOMX|nr:Hypothetical protein SMAX5B_013014 [Scophthalmus maximus]
MQEDDDDSWAKRASFTVDEALEILDPSCRQAEGDGGQESPPPLPPLVDHLREMLSHAPRPLPLPQLADHVPTLDALIRDLPDIISRVAGRKEFPIAPGTPSTCA